MPREPLVRVDDAGRTYGYNGAQYTALEHANGLIYPGARVALVGRTGSGKSTLLHLMAGLDMPTSGSVSWPGLGQKDTLRPSKIGMVFQSPSLVPWLDVTENLALPLQLVGQSTNTRELALAALHRFDLDHLATRLPEELSGGQAQRVSLARATITKPALLLADEPTGQLDHDTGVHLMDALLGWADQNEAALIVATHDLNIASRFATCWRIEQGTFSATEELA